MAATWRSLAWLLLVGVVAGALAPQVLRDPMPWSSEDLDVIASLALDALAPLLPDTSNAFAEDPAAASLGHALFFDARLSADATVSCATCHLPERAFTDGLALSRGIGEVPRTSMTIVGSAYARWLFWDGRKDSLWSQALAPFESPVEHGIDRSTVVLRIHQHHRDAYEGVFGPLPDMADVQRFPTPAGPLADEGARARWEAMGPADREAVNRAFVNVGKAIAAYERTILPGTAPFDRFARALADGDMRRANAELDAEERAGLRLFIGSAGCVDCHAGPLLTNGEFHVTGVPVGAGRVGDDGRATGAREVASDPFNCAGPYSDAAADACDELRFLRMDDARDVRAFKTPTLRNVAEMGPYMHAGQFATLEEVVRHYVAAPPAPRGQSELRALRLSDRDVGHLVAFLGSLSGPLDAPEGFLAPPDGATAVPTR